VRRENRAIKASPLEGLNPRDLWPPSIPLVWDASGAARLQSGVVRGLLFGCYAAH